MINPKHYLGNNNKRHRSDVILQDRLEDEKGKEVYSFWYMHQGAVLVALSLKILSAFLD
jgi:hypothetical protein